MGFLEWQNVLFELPVIGAMMMALVTAFGGGGHEAQADHDVSVDHDVGLGHDVDAHAVVAEHGLEHGVEHTVEHEHSHEVAEQDANPFLKALTFLGLGRVPISVIMVSFGLLWGFTGYTANQLLAPVLRWPLFYVWFSLAAATFVAVFGSRILAHLFARFMPSMQTYVSSSQSLVAQIGIVRITVGEQFGTVQVHDAFGNLLEVPCRVPPGHAAIPAGNRVVLMKYLPGERLYIVRQDLLTGARQPGALPPTTRKESV